MKRISFIALIMAVMLAGCNNNDPTAVKSVTLDKHSLEMEIGEKTTLNAVIDPENAEAEIVWESSKPKIVSVNKSGRIEALASGRATITAFCGKRYDECLVNVVAPKPAEITIYPSVKDVACTGESFTLNINCSSAWKAECKESWVTLSDKEGIGDKKITVTVEQNVTFDSDKATVKIYGNQASVELQINRAGRTPEAIILTPGTINAPAAGGTFKVQVLSAISWTTQVPESWATISPTSGSGDGEVTVTVSPSNTTKNTKQEIVFDNSEKKEKLIINRTGRDPLPITLSQNVIGVPVAGGTYKVTVNSELPFTATSSVDWVQVSVDGKIATVVVTENNNGTHVGAQVLFKTEENSAVLSITQNQPILSLSADYLYSPDEGAELEFKITCNFLWTLTTSSSWVTASEYSGNGDKTIKVTVSEATSAETTTSYITVKCANLTKSIQVVRSGFNPKCFTASVFGDKIYFAPGNLYYTATTNKFSFAPAQYSYLGVLNTYIGPDNGSPIDLFGRGTSGYKYKPYTYTNSSIATNYCPKSQAQYLSGTQHDWGTYNAIGSDPAGTWRVPHFSEWEYILKKRKNCYALHTLATVAGKWGLIILPDHFQWPSGVTKFTGQSTDYTTYVYDASAWQKMENAGAVFLPAAGIRDEQEVTVSGSEGYYWTSKADYISSGQPGYGTNVGYVLHFKKYDIILSETNEEGRVWISNGCSVRLVKDVGAQG